MMSSSRNLVTFLFACGLVAALSWFAGYRLRPAQKLSGSQPAAPTVITTGVASPPPIKRVALGRPLGAPPSFKFTKVEKMVLAMDPEKDVKDTLPIIRSRIFKDCKQRLPKATEETCEKIVQATARVVPKFTRTQQQFLRGEIDKTTFQSDWHHHFLERYIAMEQFLSFKELMAFEGLPAGDDPFMTLMLWFRNGGEEHKLGEDVLARTPEDAERADPWKAGSSDPDVVPDWKPPTIIEETK